MGLRDKFKRRIKNKERDIKQLEAEVGKEKAYLQALKDSLKDIPRDDTDEPTTMKLRKGSMCYKARELLEQTSHPMHIEDIITGIGMEFNSDTRSSLRGSLGPYLRKGQIFIRTAPNTFGLIGVNYEEELTSKKLSPKYNEEEDNNNDNNDEENFDIEPF